MIKWRKGRPETKIECVKIKKKIKKNKSLIDVLSKFSLRCRL